MKKLLLVLALSISATAQNSVDRFAHAVAGAEGFGKKGSIPTRYHNPGDLKAVKGWKYPGQVRIGKANHVVFVNDAAGWAALRHQIQRVIDGDSKHYSVNMTIAQMGRQYAGFWSRWSKNVSKNLGVDTKTKLWDILDVPPSVNLPPVKVNLEEVL
jgi:hypothetical protein